MQEFLLNTIAGGRQAVLLAKSQVTGPAFIETALPNVYAHWGDFLEAMRDTLIMELWAGGISFVIGLSLGIVLTVTRPGGILENKVLY